MPNDSHVSSYTGVFRLASPSDPHRRVSKRNRQVVSCVPCRNRKLKCDRQQPCASCVRRHDVAACQFSVGPGRGSGSGTATGLSAPGCPVPKREMQTKLAMLENLVQSLVLQSGEHGGTLVREGEGDAEASRSTTVGHGASSPAAPQAAAQTPLAGEHLSTGEGSEMRFVGVTNYQAILECIRDLHGLVEATEHTPAPVTTSSSRQHGQGGSTYTDLQDGPKKMITIQEVRERLPSRAECDAILTFYFQHIYMIPVIIHTSQFQRAYEKFWQNPDGTSLVWISLLFSVLSASLFQQASLSVERGDCSRPLPPIVTDKITGLSSMAYRCLIAGDHLAGKPYSVEATLIYAIHLVLQDRDAEPLCWHTIETVVRLAQRSGYHRDAQNLKQNNGRLEMSPFDVEMRRRTWAYLEYFDVVYSFQHGVPPIIRAEDVDTQLPSNLRDEEFSEDSRILPQARSTWEYTPVLPVIYGARLNKLLRRVFQQALAVKCPSYGDVRILDEELKALHADVPPSLRYRPVRESGFADAPDIIIRRFLLEISYLKTMCILHRRYLTLKDAMYEGSRSACCEAAQRILDLQVEFDEHSGAGGRLYEKRHLFRDPTGSYDFLLAAVCIFLDLTADSNNKNGSSKHHERKMTALSKARTIWSTTSNHSKDAAHATKVLDEILSQVSQVSQPETGGTSARSVAGERTAALKAGLDASSSQDNTHDAEAVGDSGGPLPQRNWSTMNPNLPSEKAPRKSYSVEWDFEWLDNLGKRKDHALDGALDGFLTNGVDWNRIDSLLLDREHTTGAAAFPFSQGEHSDNGQRVSREGWPYISYKQPDG